MKLSVVVNIGEVEQSCQGLQIIMNLLLRLNLAVKKSPHRALVRMLVSKKTKLFLT